MQGEDVRARLLHSAGPVFAEKGYQAATVREICARAGVNVASVNYYFGDKETLYIETVKLARQLRADQFPMPKRPEGTSPEQRLRDFVRTMVYRMVDTQEADWNTRLMLREVLRPTKACRALVESYFRPQFEVLLTILREMLPPDTSRDVCRKIGFSVVGQILFYRVAGDVVALMTSEEDRQEQFGMEQIADHITRMCLAALGMKPLCGDRGAGDIECGEGRETEHVTVDTGDQDG